MKKNNVSLARKVLLWYSVVLVLCFDRTIITLGRCICGIINHDSCRLYRKSFCMFKLCGFT